MPGVQANGIEIAYETFGRSDAPPIILIMGLGSQMVSWPTEFCRRLAATGFFVVRFDNRDVGLSSKLDAAGIPDVMKLMTAMGQKEPVTVPYGLADMALDTVGLMDALDISRAHVCGLSMGGMIAQTMAIMHPQRMLSLSSMESTSGAPGLPPAQPEVLEVMLQPAPADRKDFIAYMVKLHGLFAGRKETFDARLQAEISGQAYDRSFYPPGVARQYAAILTAVDRTEALSRVGIPALIVHGGADTLLPVAHGQSVADAIPGATLTVIDGLGHGTAFPSLWDQMITCLKTHITAVA